MIGQQLNHLSCYQLNDTLVWCLVYYPTPLQYSGYFTQVPDFLKEVSSTPANGEITFYDSNTGKPLFYAPRGRTMAEFLRESRSHGWPSFRDNEVNWAIVRVLNNGETVSLDGTHLGHNLPDGKGSRYCINLVCIAGNPI
jgi:hypothetical protein